MSVETPDSIPENLKSRLKDSYDAIADTYTEWSIKSADIRVGYLDKLLALLSPSHHDILEIGCGAGIPTTEKLLAHSPDFRITANDLSSSQIALGKKRLAGEVGCGGDRVTWVEGDMMQLDFPAESLDVVLGFYAIQHLPRDEQSVMIRRLARWLKPGGYMLVNFTTEEADHVVMTNFMGEKGWIYYSGRDEVKQVNAKAGHLWIIGKKPGG
ncbi:hypothetical protein VMCG_05910 [Cytospora schulzeri]|uniref:Methyltransferase domain-containing protein n=1 Tax=Cytospora schulzeri TaxID=448051 RepID=A0A423WCY4_9PEZI|nr:hypothetical protein VMCG_05910 [Valsa malicola]